MKTLKRVGVFIAAATLAIVGTPNVAHAASSQCSINGAYPWLPNTCYTYSVWANPNFHGVDFHVWPYLGCQADYVIRDIANNVVVRSGRTSGQDGSVYGLYSAYRLEVTRVGSGCGGVFIIENE